MFSPENVAAELEALAQAKLASPLSAVAKEERIALIDRFAKTFENEQISFNPDWNSSQSNHFPDPYTRQITLGGTALSGLSLDALAVTIAHEVAHFTAIEYGSAGGLACERYADYYGVRHVLPKVFPETWKEVAKTGLKELWQKNYLTPVSVNLEIDATGVVEEAGAVNTFECGDHPKPGCRHKIITAAIDEIDIPACE